MPVYLKALALRNYRGIGNSIQTMPNFKTFNFFIGANNAGKSTVLNFISRHLPKLSGFNQIKSGEPLKPLEIHGSQGASKIYMAIGFSIDQAMKDVQVAHPNLFKERGYPEVLKKLLETIAGEHDLIWKGSDIPYRGVEFLKIENYEQKSLSDLFNRNQWQSIWGKLTNHSGGDLTVHWIPDTIKAIEKALDISTPNVRLIPAIRQLVPRMRLSRTSAVSD